MDNLWGTKDPEDNSKEDDQKQPEAKKASELTDEEVNTLIGETKPTLTEAATKKTAFSAVADDFVAPQFAENKDYTIEASNPVFEQVVLANKTIPNEVREAAKEKMLNGINTISYTITVTSKKDATDKKEIQKSFDVSGFISKAAAEEIFKALTIEDKANVDKSVVRIEPSTDKGMTKAYKFMHGTYSPSSLDKLDLITVTKPENSVDILVGNTIDSTDVAQATAKLRPIVYLDKPSKEYIFAYKDKTDTKSESNLVTVTELPTPILSAKAIENFYAKNSSTKIYEINVEETVKKLGKALDQVLPSEITKDQIVIAAKAGTLTAQNNDQDTFQVTPEMLEAFNGAVSELTPLDDQGMLFIRVSFNTVIKPNAIYMLANKSQTTDAEVAKKELGEFKLKLEGLKVKEAVSEPATGEENKPAEEAKVLQGTALVLRDNATAEYVAKVTAEKAKSIASKGILQWYSKDNKFGITSGGAYKDQNNIIELASGVQLSDLKLIKSGKNYYMNGSYDPETKTLKVQYSQKINGEFKDVEQSFVLK
ncbi:hypothetical protein [Mycoplasma sp. Z1473D]